MKTRPTLLLGLAGLGFVLGSPVQAAPLASIDLQASAKLAIPEFRDAGFVLAKRDESDRYESRFDPRDQTRAKGNKKPHTREAERFPEHQDYGYGYERRQQPAPRNDDHGRH